MKKIISTILLFIVFLTGQCLSWANDGIIWYESVWKMINEQYVDTSFNNQDWTLWRNKYDDYIKTDEDAYIAISVMLNSLNDDYTFFMLPEEFSDMTTSFSGKKDGFGFILKNTRKGIKITKVYPKSPAANCGLKAGDLILAINGKELEGLNFEKALSLIDSADNTINLLIHRKNDTDSIYSLTSAEYEINPVSTKPMAQKIEIPNNILYARIESFANKLSAQYFFDLYKNSTGITGIIIDLRGNSGGYVDRAATVANMFLKNKTIVTTIDRNGKAEVVKANEHLMTDIPLVVIIDETSASASEIFAAAMQDNDRAKLVGKTSFGKGIVQKFEKLPNNAGLNFTVKKYLTPNGNDIHKKGVQPDYTVKNSILDKILNKDSQLEFAIDLLQNQNLSP